MLDWFSNTSPEIRIAIGATAGVLGSKGIAYAWRRIFRQRAVSSPSNNRQGPR